MCYRTGLVETSASNTRLQPCRISVKSSGTAPSTCSDTNVGNILDYTYNFSLGSENNGNVTSVTNNITPGRSQSYTYDELNRISTAVAQATSGQFCWGQDFTYDAWANLTNIILDPNRPSCSATGLSVAMIANNQLSAPPYHYDAAGNITADGTNSYTFNAENQVVTVAGLTYTYDGAGNRVKKSNGKLYWNGDGGEALDETDASGNLTDEYIFFGGARIARRDSSNNVVYYFSDHLGTTHIVTNSSGTIQDDSDFYPFGGERVVTSSSGNAYKFTGKERDTESGLDNFGARFYASTTGRFLSPDDTKYASLADPQTLNLYSYVGNHPLTMTDPTGHSADPWAHLNLPYNSATQEMQGGGVGSVLGGDSGGADGGMAGATSDGSESVQHQDEQNNVVYERSQFSGTLANGNSNTNAEPDPSQATTAVSAQNQSTQQTSTSQQCEAQMRSRPGDITSAWGHGASHAWWYVVDDSGKGHTLSFTMNMTIKGPYLNAYAADGSQSSSNLNDNLNHGSVIFDVKGASVCAGVAKMIQATKDFPHNSVRYGPLNGQATSNSGARYLGGVGGFKPPMPSQPGLRAVGWNLRIPGVER